MSTPALEVEDLHKAFGGLRVSRGVSLRVRRGEIHALIGPNGAGKTTLVAQIAGQLRPDAGRIRIMGRDVTRASVAARVRAGLGRSFQMVSLMDGLSVRDNLILAHMGRRGGVFSLFPPLSRRADLHRAAAASLAAFGLEGLAAARPPDLSHGQRRLLELAMALAGDPPVLLLDEPMAGLGAEQARAMIERLRALRGRHAVLLVEHDMEAVFALADRISVLVAGAVIATGAPDEIRADARVRAAYLGAAAG
ncbi:MAG TPA: ABC transporter ATP-binding protein [Thermopetrobacter sp.]|nr:ABC transporter ATP-binding protein [Thermopetrobacter sp.]